MILGKHNNMSQTLQLVSKQKIDLDKTIHEIGLAYH